ncbi:HAD-IIA family hydrolase, partial [Dietzia sp.]|uniref:HAD-IIA family hydrolase n=1 Tax=Dietzia sp. TaxID=1871616 RepID=UPI002FD89C15
TVDYRNAYRLDPGAGDSSSAPLVDGYDGLLVDLDGTLIRGNETVEFAPEALAAAGVPVAFVTNNASKSPAEIVEGLVSHGYAADLSNVINSAQAAVSMVAETVPAGTRVLVVGAPAFADLAAEAGFEVVNSADDAPEVVLQGLSKQLTWAELAEGSLAIRAGARWVASNTDATLPTERGFLPGNGSLVAALVAATDRRPEVAGKPGSEIMRRAAEMIGSRKPLVVGDRLDTDIAGGVAAGMDTLMVLTGVSDSDDAAAADSTHRPTYVAAGMDALGLPVVPTAQAVR